MSDRLLEGETPRVAGPRPHASATLPPLGVLRAALSGMWRHRRSLLLAYLLVLGPGYLLSRTGLLPRFDPRSGLGPAAGELGDFDLVSSLLFSFLSLLLDAAAILLLTGAAGSASGSSLHRTARWLRATAVAYPFLLLVWLLRSLVLAPLLIRYEALVLAPPVVAWLCLAQVLTVAEGRRNPLRCLLISKRWVSGHVIEVLFCLALPGLPLLAGNLGLWRLDPGDAAGWLPQALKQAGDVLHDLLGLVYTAVTVELYRRLKPE